MSAASPSISEVTRSILTHLASVDTLLARIDAAAGQLTGYGAAGRPAGVKDGGAGQPLSATADPSKLWG